MGLVYSAEQNRIFEMTSGPVIVVANAGTGKTSTTAELMVRRYLDEERALFPHRSEHVSGDEQRRILRQFLCITFTVKAAAEYDSRIKELFAERGIPAPKKWNGDDYRIGRTLDSYIGRWLRLFPVFAAWMEADPDTHERLKVVLGELPAGLRQTLQCTGNGLKDCHALSMRWPWIVGDDLAEMLLDLILRKHAGVPLDGCDGDQWAEDFNEGLGRLQLAGGERIALDFWEGPLAAWKKHHEHLRDMDHAIKQGKPLPVDDQAKGAAEVFTWERMNTLRAEFIAVEELARARGYHPVYAPERLACRIVEDQIAAAEHLKGYREFLFLSQKWHFVKTHFLLREFGDQTTAFVRACEKHPELLEPTVEYPRLVRAKYVFWDECQDNSDYQHRILKLFDPARAGVPHLNVAIGDPKQQIYVWRGASPRRFLEMIEEHRRNHPGRLLGLSVSFRSAKRIVELGNEVILTLPSYRDKVRPSTTIFEDEGRVEVTKPFVSMEEEAEWTFSRIEYYLGKTKAKIMVLSRTDPADHPLYYRHLRTHPELGRRISCLTIHRAKGLEADIVFVLGLYAGRMPDPRSNMDEEVNLFYVACTRARQTLILCGLVCKREVNLAGHIEDTRVGPTPFFAQLPTLRNLCLKGGWTKELLAEGVETNNRGLAGHYGRIAKRRSALRIECADLFRQTIVGGEAREDLKDYGATDADPAVNALTRRKLGLEESAGGSQRGRFVSEQARDRVLKQCLEAYRLRGQPPRFTSEDFRTALKCGWIVKPDGARYWQFSASLKQQADLARSAVGTA